MGLPPPRAARVYDRIGRVQDWQAFYEDRAITRLLAQADLGHAASVLEIGCGTGRLAEHMLSRLPPTVEYLGLDVSQVMARLATARLAPWPNAQVTLIDGTLPLPVADHRAERIVSTYVFDLLDDEYARDVLVDLQRAIAPDGLLCLASLTFGVRWRERAVSACWSALSRRVPAVVGGCRPVRLQPILDETGWRVRHHSRVHSWGLVTEVVVAAPRPAVSPVWASEAARGD